MNFTLLPSSSVLIHSWSGIFVPCTLQKRKRMRLQLGLLAFTSHDPRSGLVHFLFSGEFGHPRLCQVFLDAGECRFAGFFLAFFTPHRSIITSGPEPYGPI